MGIVTARNLIGNYKKPASLTVTADTAILENDLELRYPFSFVTIAITPTLSGIVSFTRTIGGVSKSEILNSGVALVAGANYSFTFAALQGETFNVKYSVGDTLKYLMVYETS